MGYHVMSEDAFLGYMVGYHLMSLYLLIAWDIILE
jgi:hypothetical protein